MLQYAFCFILLQNHSTCFGCHSTRHQEYYKTLTAASGTDHNIGTATSLQWFDRDWPRWREVAVPILWPLPEAAVAVFGTPDDGCCDTRNMWSDFAVNKYLHNVASGRIFISIELWCTEPWVLKKTKLFCLLQDYSEHNVAILSSVRSVGYETH